MDAWMLNFIVRAVRAATLNILTEMKELEPF